MTETSDDYEWPQSLKANLELLAQLQQNEGIRKKVTEEVLKKVEKYITKDVDRFATEATKSGYLYKAIEKCQKLRTNIVANKETYKHYTQPFQDGDANKYSQHLIDNIFPLFGCLYYMYYECASECSFIKGGDWRDEKCDGSEGDQYLNKWLRDITGKKIKSSDHSSTLMIDRGFEEGGLSKKEGKTLFPPRTSTTALLYFKDGDQLQYTLFYMLFLPEDGKWDNAQSGHAVLFLEAFCQKVKDGDFNGQYKEAEDDVAFKRACQTVTRSIQKLISSKTIVPVAWSPTVNYERLLEVTHFWSYITWLKDNVTRLGASLLQMEKDAKNWEEESLKTSKAFGPYPWGFVFKRDWEWQNKQRLNEPLETLIKALRTLQSAIDNIKPIPPSSPASTVGSVIGGVGATGAAAGAAYAGSSFLGPVAEGIGKFFKGLFL